SRRVEEVVNANVPEGAKPAILVALAEGLAKAPAELVKQLFDGGLAIWKEWRGGGAGGRKQVHTPDGGQGREAFVEDNSRALSAIGVIALLAGLLLPGERLRAQSADKVPGEQLRAQEVDKDGLYSQPFLVLDPDMHTAPIRAVVTDAAGRYIITGSDDKS